MQYRKRNNEIKADILCKNIKLGKYNGCFLKIKVDNNGYITDFRREIPEELKGDVEDD